MAQAQVITSEGPGQLEIKWDPTEGEGERKPTTLKNPLTGEVFEVIDRPFEEKALDAMKAGQKRAEEYEEKTKQLARFYLDQWDLIETVDRLKVLPPGDLDLYLQVEAENQNRQELFDIFGQPSTVILDEADLVIPTPEKTSKQQKGE